ncbi:MAG: hypothetical protein ACRDYF_08335, partial [Acidimicrobiia bacterium]
MIPLAALPFFRPGWLWAAAAVWFAAALTAAATMRRRGHDGFAWAVLFAVLGPLAVPLAVSAERHRPPEPSPGEHPGPLDVLVAVDPAAGTEATTAIERLVAVAGERVSSVTLA